MARQAVQSHAVRSAGLWPIAAAASLATLGCVRNLSPQQSVMLPVAGAHSPRASDRDAQQTSLLSAMLHRAQVVEPAANMRLELATAERAPVARNTSSPAGAERERPLVTLGDALEEPRREQITQVASHGGTTAATGAARQGGPATPRSQSSATPVASATRCEWAEALGQRGRQRLERAEDLAARGAVYTARQEMVEVLRMVALTCDTQQQVQMHSAALAQALYALDEADDFLRAGSDGRAPSSVESIAAAHRTTALRGLPTAQMTPLEAVQLYCSAAVRDFTIAGAGQPVAAEALHALGRVTALQHSLGLGAGERAASMAEQKMLVYYQSAALVDPGNYRATNELGVLLVRFGQLHRAKAALEQSVAACSQPENCRNLAAVYESLGDHAASQRVSQRGGTTSANAAAPERRTSDPQGLAPVVYWVDPATMAAQGATSVDTAPDVARQTNTKSPAALTGGNRRPSLSGSVRRWTSTLFGKSSHDEAPR